MRIDNDEWRRARGPFVTPASGSVRHTQRADASVAHNTHIHATQSRPFTTMASRPEDSADDDADDDVATERSAAARFAAQVRARRRIPIRPSTGPPEVDGGHRNAPTQTTAANELPPSSHPQSAGMLQTVRSHRQTMNPTAPAARAFRKVCSRWVNRSIIVSREQAQVVSRYAYKTRIPSRRVSVLSVPGSVAGTNVWFTRRVNSVVSSSPESSPFLVETLYGS